MDDDNITVCLISADELNTCFAADKNQFETLFKNSGPDSPNTHYLCAIQNHHMVGAIKLNLPPDSDYQFEFIEVAQPLQRHGIAQKMIGDLFARAEKNHKTIVFDGFTESGRSHLLKIIDTERYTHPQVSYVTINRF